MSTDAAPLVFLDTETTGLSPSKHDIWQVFALRINPDGFSETWDFLVEHDPAPAAELPEPYRSIYLENYDPDLAWSRVAASDTIMYEIFESMEFGRPILVGAVPDFDARFMTQLMIDTGYLRVGDEFPWHYHLLDVETLCAGFLAARGTSVPWPIDSDELTRLMGVTAPTDTRHTARGDVLWAKALYDAVHGQ